MKTLSIFVAAFCMCSLFACAPVIEHFYLLYGKNAVVKSFNIYLNEENYLYRIVNNNVPNFDLSKYDGTAFENYQPGIHIDYATGDSYEEK